MKFSRKNSNERFVEGFITASLLFCIGSMSTVGAIQEGLNGNTDILFAKSLLDGVTSIAFSAAMGVGVMFSAIPTFLYQGGLTLLAQILKGIFTPEMIIEITAVGGIIILGIGFNLSEIKKFKVANFLPALLIAFFLSLYF